MRLATYNVENLFERARAMNGSDWREGRDILAAHARLNGILGKPRYTAADRRAMQAALETLGLARSDQSALALLRQNRGRPLRARRGGVLEFVAGGREEWIGWVDLRTEPVNATAIDNTGRVIGLLGADVLAVIEAENRPSLTRFNQQVLPRVGAPPFAHVMLVDGNDDRGIDVGLLTGAGFPIRSVASHVDDRDGEGRPLFSRDCPEYEVELPGGGGALWVLVNHFKSQGYGAKAANDARRRAQASRVREIYAARLAAGAELVAVVGDLNNPPDAPPLAPLLAGRDAPRDIQEHPRFLSDGRSGTWKNGSASQRLDYLLLSPALWERVAAGGIERRGVWGGTRGTLFPHLDEITREEEAASDHAALWVDLDLG
jgi:endonuclease/exonuclease/phosphatase family metal-dependent hydrolase